MLDAAISEAAAQDEDPTPWLPAMRTRLAELITQPGPSGDGTGTSGGSRAIGGIGSELCSLGNGPPELATNDLPLCDDCGPFAPQNCPCCCSPEEPGCGGGGGGPPPDPCDGDPDPCCGSTDPCCGSTDPCCGIGCDDGDPCTDDECVDGGCVFTPIDCDDSDPCTDDACVDGDCVNTPKDCDDGDLCTEDDCDPATGECTHTEMPHPDDFDCDGIPDDQDPDDDNDGILDEDENPGCEKNPDRCCGVVCDDGDPCTDDSCSQLTGLCKYVPTNCDDGNPCTIDSCDPALGGCVHTPRAQNDEDPCTDDICDPQTGVTSHPPKDCDDGDPCTDDSCNPATGACVNTPKDCDDNDPCTDDSCNPATGACVNTPKNCDDGDPCTIDSCDPLTGACVHTPKDCNDNNACTIDSCNPATGICQNTPIDCNDNNACTIDSCDPSTGICNHMTISCDDGDPCTQDSCDPMTGICLHVSMFSVDIATPAEGDVFLVGAQAPFSVMTTPGTTYTWTVIQGQASPMTATGPVFTPTLQSEGPLIVRLTAAAQGVSCETDREIEVIKPQVIEVSFLDDIQLKQWQTNDTGPMIMDPVWIKPLGGAVTKNQPAAYRRSIGPSLSTLAIQARLAAAQNLANPATIQLQASHSSGTPDELLVFTVETQVQTWPTAGHFMDSSPLPGWNGAYDPLLLQWEYRVTALDGTWSDWIGINASAHRIYHTSNMPLTSPVLDLALEKVCLRYANGLIVAPLIAGACNSGIDADLCYNPGSGTPFDPNALGTALNAYGSGACLCWHNALLLRLLVNSTGIPGDVRLFYGGRNLGTGDTFEYPSGTGNFFLTMRANAPAHDLAPAQPHFRYHAQTLISGTYYDPSYGTVGRAQSLHQCDGVGAVLLEGASFPTTFMNCGWADSHGLDPPAPGCP